MSIIKKYTTYIKQKRKTSSKLTVRTPHNYYMGSRSNRFENRPWIDIFVFAFIRSELVFFNTFNSCLKNKEEKTFFVTYRRRSG
jgi:hypothetical protein